LIVVSRQLPACQPPTSHRAGLCAPAGR